MVKLLDTTSYFRSRCQFSLCLIFLSITSSQQQAEIIKLKCQPVSVSCSSKPGKCKDYYDVCAADVDIRGVRHPPSTASHCCCHSDEIDSLDKQGVKTCKEIGRTEKLKEEEDETRYVESRWWTGHDPRKYFHNIYNWIVYFFGNQHQQPTSISQPSLTPPTLSSSSHPPDCRFECCPVNYTLCGDSCCHKDTHLCGRLLKDGSLPCCTTTTPHEEKRKDTSTCCGYGAGLVCSTRLPCCLFTTTANGDVCSLPKDCDYPSPVSTPSFFSTHKLLVLSVAVAVALLLALLICRCCCRSTAARRAFDNSRDALLRRPGEERVVGDGRWMSAGDYPQAENRLATTTNGGGGVVVEEVNEGEEEEGSRVEGKFWGRRGPNNTDYVYNYYIGEIQDRQE
eukprot:GHVS01063236.1.p1 GENE.GHVS01063236.1~~GHVS01063236.1.p1  ORF type:complete len:395 (-),score=85.14 GHVS01063236.1:253-1437(-)